MTSQLNSPHPAPHTRSFLPFGFLSLPVGTLFALSGLLLLERWQIPKGAVPSGQDSACHRARVELKFVAIAVIGRRSNPVSQGPETPRDSFKVTKGVTRAPGPSLMECGERDLRASSVHIAGSCDCLNRLHGLRARGFGPAVPLLPWASLQGPEYQACYSHQSFQKPESGPST